MPDKQYPDPKLFMEFDENDPRFQVKILGMRVDTLTKEKEEIEQELRDERAARTKEKEETERVLREMDKRVAAMERTFQRGAGAMIVLPIIGTLMGVLFAYGKVIFAPWIGGIKP